MTEPSTTSAKGTISPLLLMLGLVWIVLLWGLSAAGRLDTSPSGLLLAIILVLPWFHLATTAGLLCLLTLHYSSHWLRILTGIHLVLGIFRPDSIGMGTVFSKSAVAPQLSVTTWNLAMLGEGQDTLGERCDTRETERAATQTLREDNADVLVLLEISAIRLAKLKTNLGLSCEHTDYYGNGTQTKGGLAVCVRSDSEWRITRERKLELPPEWTYVFAELSTRGKTPTVVNVLGVHLSPLGITTDHLADIFHRAPDEFFPHLSTLLQQMSSAGARQWEQADKIRGQVQSGFKDPTVLAGDFNAVPDNAIHYRFRTSFVDSWEEAGWGSGITRTVGFLPLRIDYIYTTETLTTQRIETFDCFCDANRKCSDHRGISSTMALDH